MKKKKEREFRRRKKKHTHSTSTYASTMLMPLCGSRQTVENSLKDGNTRQPSLPPGDLYACHEAAFRTGQRTINWLKIGK